MLKSYYDSSINNTITRNRGEDMTSIPSDNDINPSSASSNQTVAQINNTSENEELFKKHMQDDRFFNETNIEGDDGQPMNAWLTRPPIGRFSFRITK